MQPLDPWVEYGITEWDGQDIEDVLHEPLPDKTHELRRKLHQKAKAEPKFRFYALYDRVYRKDVLEAAFKRVGKRGKAAGVDGIKAEDILKEKGGVTRFVEEIHEELTSKTYRASPVKRVFIPKADGKLRPLGIPTLKDRVVQMAVLLILEPIFEADFMDCSHGFRPGRKAHDALEAIRENLKSGRTEVYDADLKGYFDSIPHDKLMACVRMRVVDSSVLKLIRMWLKAPIIETDEKGRMQPPKKNRSGTPQGGVISPLLANVYLHWFDKQFYRQSGPGCWANARLVRYADDFVILARYQGYRIDEWVKGTLEEWMGLRLNPAKTKTVNVWKGEGLDFLGYTFQNHRDQYGRDKVYLNVFPSKKSMQRARQTLKEKTNAKRCFKPAVEVVKDLNGFLQGWGNYFSYGYSRKGLRDISHYARGRMIRHLNRRSQRKYARPEGMSHYAHLEQLGLVRL
jgi:RNA-directed DNA polymerase